MLYVMRYVIYYVSYDTCYMLYVMLYIICYISYLIIMICVIYVHPFKSAHSQNASSPITNELQKSSLQETKSWISISIASRYRNGRMLEIGCR